MAIDTLTFDPAEMELSIAATIPADTPTEESVFELRPGTPGGFSKLWRSNKANQVLKIPGNPIDWSLHHRVVGVEREVWTIAADGTTAAATPADREGEGAIYDHSAIDHGPDGPVDDGDPNYLPNPASGDPAPEPPGPVNPPPEAPNDDLVFVNTLIVVPASTGAATDLLFTYPNAEIGKAGDTQDLLGTLTGLERMYLSGPAGNNLLVNGGLPTDGGDYYLFVFNSQVPVGIFTDGEQVDVWIEVTAATIEFDPSTSTIPQVQAYINSLGDPNDPAVIAETQRVLDVERAGSNRSSLVAWLDARPGVV